MRCEEIMTRNPATLPPTATVLDAARLMAKEDIGFVPVVDPSGNATGVVTDRDLVVKGIAKSGDAGKLPLSQVMQTEVFCCTPDEDVEQVKQHMAERQVQRMLVCQANSKKPVGVVSLQDLARADTDIGGTVRGVKEGAGASARTH